MPTPFDWKGAVTFAHGTFSGPSRVCYSLLQSLISGIILTFLFFLIKLVVDAGSKISEDDVESAGKSIKESVSGFANTDKLTIPTGNISAPTVIISTILGFTAWVWTMSFSAACYEHWRNLEPDNSEQKDKESGKEPK